MIDHFDELALEAEIGFPGNQLTDQNYLLTEIAHCPGVFFSGSDLANVPPATDRRWQEIEMVSLVGAWRKAESNSMTCGH